MKSKILLLTTLWLVATLRLNAATEKPNIVFILADDLGYGDLSCYGQERFLTPNIDALAKGGMRFTQAYAASSISAPSRCGLLTGRNMGHSIVRDNLELADGQYPLPAGTVTLASMLKSAGYHTACIGKWGLGGTTSPGAPNKQGFDYFYGYINQRTAHNYFPPTLWRNTEKVELKGNPPLPGKDEKPTMGKQYSADLIADEAVKFIDNSKESGQPFFLYFTPTIPHAGMQVPEDSLQPFLGKFPEHNYLGSQSYMPTSTPNAAYAGMITRLDKQVGEIVAALDRNGMRDNTLIIFTSDNGPSNEGGNSVYFFKSAGPFKMSHTFGPVDGGKGGMYESGLRLPFIANWQGKIRSGQVSDQIIAHWDMMPTFAELAGIKAPENDGISIIPALFESGQMQGREYLYWELRGQQAVRLGDWKGIRRHKNGVLMGMELYDLSKDPMEKDNVADQHPDIVERVTEIMDKEHTPSVRKQWDFKTEDVKQAQNGWSPDSLD